MFVVSVYGRAGQGVESCVAVLAKAASVSQLNAQSLFFPSQDLSAAVFGQVKIDKGSILSKQVEDYDFALLFDRNLDTKSIITNGKERSSVILNSAEKFISPLLKKKKMRAYSLDASGIALRAAAKPNMAMLGAFAKLYPKITLKSVRSLVEHDKAQLTALEEGYKMVK